MCSIAQRSQMIFLVRCIFNFSVQRQVSKILTFAKHYQSNVEKSKGTLTKMPKYSGPKDGLFSSCCVFTAQIWEMCYYLETHLLVT